MEIKKIKAAENIHDGHRERMREKFLKYGFEAFAPHEKIEYLLFVCKSRGNTNPLAHELIRRFGSFSGVLDAPYEELLAVKGVGPVTAAFFKMLPQAYRCYEKDHRSNRVRMFNTQEMVNYLKGQYVGILHELVILMLLDGGDRVLYCDVVNEGSATAVNVYTQKIVTLAARYKAVYAVLSHNHPSGNALPSKEDLVITRKVFDALYGVDVLLIDHIVIAGDDFTSLKDCGVMRDLFPREGSPSTAMLPADGAGSE